MTVVLPSAPFLAASAGPVMYPKETLQQPYSQTVDAAADGNWMTHSDGHGLKYGHLDPVAASSTARSPHSWDVPYPAGPVAGPSTLPALGTSMALQAPRQQATGPYPKRRRHSGPPKNSTDALARWFAELVSWIWFSPSSSSLIGTSRPMTPVRSPTSSFAPHQPSPLASTGRRPTTGSLSHSSDDRFAMLGAASSASGSSNSISQLPDTEAQLRRASPATSPWSTGPLDDSSSPDLRFHPQEKFVAFIRDTIKTTQVSTSVLILALLYVQRLKLQHPKLRGQEGSEYRLSVTAMMLGNKFLDDHTYTNKTWSDISGIPLKDITKMEIEFWLGLQMRIYVHQTDYEAWLQTIDDLFCQRSQALWKREQRELARRKAVLQQISPKPYPPLRYSFSHFGLNPGADSMPAPLPSTHHHFSQAGFPTATGYGQSLAHDFGSAASPSPLSQHSTYSSAPTASSGSIASTYATSALQLTSDNAFEFSPEQRRVSSRKLSPLSASIASSERPINSGIGVTGPPTMGLSSVPLAPSWQNMTSTEYLPRLPPRGDVRGSSLDSGTNTSRKRGREEVDGYNEEMGRRDHKRYSLGHPAESVTLDQDSGGSYYRPDRSGALGQEQYHLATTNGLRGGTIAPGDGSASGTLSATSLGDEALYRSIFSEPLTPDCLTQGYVGPHGLSSSLRANGNDRGLAFYQLAAGKDPGLPALHLPPPVAYLGGSSQSGGSFTMTGHSAALPPASASHAARRGSFSFNGFGVSPRASWSASGNHPFGSISMSQSPYRVSAQSHQHQDRPVRLSPEAYGISYGSSVPIATSSSVGGGIFGAASSSSSKSSAPSMTSTEEGNPSIASGGGEENNNNSSSNSSRSRWMPFSNVPMSMQLEQIQQWHHIQYQQKLRAQEDEERRRRSVGAGPGAGPSNHLSGVGRL